ncbi:carboxypeptidase-like regulatory domain-containing protein [Saccharicrinis aurantiacus]|uniref:carboxypeptidase-like regulatory domain-containing protein n=1 Tax=Saccharicrinis aurantiacus TaxID=1849719 RepID=UPI0009502EDD|nr:carboxypeptidase-like regulatory domain-containing protein [Saccharicrinis aurantiacus]
MRFSILILLGLLFISNSIFAQDTNKNSQLFRGVIMDSDSTESIANARYIINDKETHITNRSGEFIFLAEKGDIIKFTHVGYKPLYLQVTDSMKNNKFLTGVFLSKDTIQLSEVVIIPQNLNPNAVARNLPLMTTNDMITAQNNLNRSAYQAKTRPVEVWDAEMNQKGFIKSQSDNIVYKHQYQPDQLVAVSNTEINAELERRRLNKKKSSKAIHITQEEWEFLISTYRERQKQQYKHLEE